MMMGVAHFKALLEAAPDAMVIVDRDGKIVLVNAQTERLFGYERADLLGNPVEMLIPGRYRDTHPKYRDQFFTDPRPRAMGTGMELHGRRKDGSEFSVEISLSLLQTEEGFLVSSAIRDTTERKKIEKLKNEFISVVSHELHTPLTSILGSLGLVVSGVTGQISPPVKEMLQIAKSNCDRLVRLINDILDLEKIERGGANFQVEPVAVLEVIEHVLQANRGIADQYCVSFRVEDHSAAACVLADRDRLIQVLTNLLSNAIKFSPRGDHVDIRIARVSGRVRFSVSDHGDGVPDSFHDQIFEKFAQADSSDSRQKGGTGLGLSICKSIIESLSGRIWFETNARQGSTFFFELPATPDTGGQHEAS